MKLTSRPHLTRATMVLCLLTTLPFASAAPAIADEPPVSKIEVIGEGQAELAPDMAILSLGVVREGKTARDALSANNEAMGEVIAAMKETGIESRDLQTSSFNIQPVYSQERPRNGERPKPPEITGYRVSNNLTVRVRDIAILGGVLDRAVSLGVNAGGGIAFTNAEPDQALSEARAEAMRDARQKAETLVEAAGVKLGPILEISENFSRPRPVPMAEARMMAADAASVPVEAGENSYTVTVRAIWKIDQ